MRAPGSETRRYVIEFRNGSFFRDLAAEHGCSITEARRFKMKEQAECYMRRHEWILFNGGMVVEVAV